MRPPPRARRASPAPPPGGAWGASREPKGRNPLPEVRSVQTHLEPLSEAAEGRRPAEADVEPDAQAVLRIVADATGRAPRELRFLRTDEGLVAFLTLGLDGASTLAEAHGRASEIEERIRRERPEIADVIVHTEP